MKLYESVGSEHSFVVYRHDNEFKLRAKNYFKQNEIHGNVGDL